MDEFTTIGGVRFSTSSIKSSEKIVHRGVEMNSVYLNDGTNIQFKDQDPENEAKVRDYSAENKDSADKKAKMQETIEENMNKPSRARKNLDLPEGRIVFENIKGGIINGTYDKDDYVLSGCQDILVDVAQEDGKQDKVFLHDSEVTIFGNDGKHENKNNLIYSREEDKVTDGLLNMNDKNYHIKVRKTEY